MRHPNFLPLDFHLSGSLHQRLVVTNQFWYDIKVSKAGIKQSIQCRYIFRLGNPPRPLKAFLWCRFPADPLLFLIRLNFPAPNIICIGQGGFQFSQYLGKAGQVIQLQSRHNIEIARLHLGTVELGRD